MLSFYLTLIDTEEEKSKFEQLYLTYRQMMFFVAKQILEDSYLAEDAVHQTFLKIIDHFDKIGEIDCPKTRGFIVTIVQNQSIDLYRKRKRQEARSFDEISYQFADNKDSDGQIEALNPVAEAITKLPVHLAAVIRLRYSQGYSPKEIAKILDISEQNVYKRIQRAKEQLSTILKEREEIGSYGDH